MPFAKRFLAQFSSLIVTRLSCVDRVIFMGYLPFHSEDELNSWVDCGLRIRRTDFTRQLDQRSELPVDHDDELTPDCVAVRRAVWLAVSAVRLEWPTAVGMRGVRSIPGVVLEDLVRAESRPGLAG